MVQIYERNEGSLSSRQLYLIQQAERRHERMLMLKRKEQRAEKERRSKELVKQHISRRSITKRAHDRARHV